MSEKSENVRAIDVLECFAADRHSLSISQIEKRARLSRPTLYRILSTLTRRGFVRKDGDPPRYRLDIGISRLADAWSNSLDIVRLATPVLEDLRERHDETVAVRDFFGLRGCGSFGNAPFPIPAIVGTTNRSIDAIPSI
jgi:DNA-binding IclR family transcriptional regulator